MYGSKGGNAWKSLPILTEGRRFESCHSEKHTRPLSTLDAVPCYAQGKKVAQALNQEGFSQAISKE